SIIFRKRGHRDLLVTQNLSQPSSNIAPLASRVAFAAGRLRSNDETGLWRPVSGNRLIGLSPRSESKWQEVIEPRRADCASFLNRTRLSSVFSTARQSVLLCSRPGRCRRHVPVRG